MDSTEDLVPFEEMQVTWNREMHDFYNVKTVKPWKRRFYEIYECAIFLKHDFEFYIFANGFKTKNKGYVTIILRKLRRKMFYETEVSFCCFIVHILDVYGNKRFSRTFQKEFREENYESSKGEFEEKYITRSSVLSNEDEFLRNNSLKFTVDVSFSRWTSTLWSLRPCCALTFSSNVEAINYLRIQDNSVCLSFYYIRKYLYKESDFFRNLCDYTIQDSSKELTGIPLAEYTALISMLIYIETGDLLLEDVTVSELYVIANKYYVPRLLNECRRIIKQSLSNENASYWLNFVKPFYDPDLKEAIEKYWNNLPLGLKTSGSEFEQHLSSGEDLSSEGDSNHEDDLNHEEDLSLDEDLNHEQDLYSEADSDSDDVSNSFYTYLELLNIVR